MFLRRFPRSASCRNHANLSRPLPHRIHAHLMDRLRFNHSDASTRPLPSRPSAATIPVYPGLGLELCYERRDYPLYPNSVVAGGDGDVSELLLVRESAMMIFMDRITDKPRWHEKVFDERIAKKWVKEALAMDPELFWYEMNGVAYEPPGQRPPYGWREMKGPPLEGILDETSLDYCIQELRTKAKHMMATGLVPTLDASASVIKSDTLIDQELHNELLRAFGKLKADRAEKPDWHPNTNNMVRNLVHPSMYPMVYGRSRVICEEVVGVEDALQRVGEGDIVNYTPVPCKWRRPNVMEHQDQNFSARFQWLPANFTFRDDGTVQCTSYINNLHPNKHPDIYKMIEKLVDKALPAWDQCLPTLQSWRAATRKHGRVSPRYPHPDNPCDTNDSNWIDNTPEGMVYDPEKDEEFNKYEYNDVEMREEYCRGRLFELFRKPKQPPTPVFKPFDYAVEEKDTLRARFRDSGLQIIVKMASVELTPEKPEFGGTNWHVEGMGNERIVGTALYYLENENVTPAHLHFRMKTNPRIDEEWAQVGQDSFYWMQEVYGVQLGVGNGEAALQDYGRVETRERRLLAFPNVFQHSVFPFRLQDATRPGHRTFVALWLVDPYTRVISTANVPPQQEEWSPGNARERAQGLMSREEAEGYRAELMKERSVAEEWREDEWYRDGGAYSFCEH